MSTFSRVMTSIATVWPAPVIDEHGQSHYGVPKTIACNFTTNGELMIDKHGRQFTPNLIIRSYDATVNDDDFLAIGDYTGNPTPQGLDAYQVRIKKTVTPLGSMQQRYTYVC